MRILKWSLLLALLPLLPACGGGSAEQEELDATAAGDADQQERMQKTRSIFYSVPSPMETSTLLK